MDFYSTVGPMDAPRTPNLSKRGTKFNLLSTLSPLKSGKKARKPVSIINGMFIERKLKDDRI